MEKFDAPSRLATVVDEKRLSLMQQYSDLLPSYVSAVKDRDLFRFKPWKRSVISSSEFGDEVRQALKSTGVWESQGEIGMGSGPSVKVEVFTGESSRKIYSATVSFGFTLGGNYVSLEKALEAASVFASLLVELYHTEIGEGLQDQMA